jgi:outer membrane protein assembly factor BamB
MSNAEESAVVDFNTDSAQTRISKSAVEIINGTFLGNSGRNYYGDSLPDKLDVIYTVYLGKGETICTVEKGVEEWAGAGWTGQTLFVKEDGEAYMLIGAYDHNLKKIRVRDGEIVWQYLFDDIIKGTGSIWHNPQASCPEMEYLILQGSRIGLENGLGTPVVPSYRAISLKTGKAVWKYNIKRTASYSRDVDASALIIDGKAYIGLENGIFTVMDPDPAYASYTDGLMQPAISKECMLYDQKDRTLHGGNLVTESSPCLLNGHVYVTSGSGHIYGFNLATQKIDWDFYVGSDMDGSPVITADSCILVTLEKQYIEGPGGVLKLDPRLPPERAVRWFFPTLNEQFAEWEGGIVGTASVLNTYGEQGFPDIAAFTGIDGWLYVVHQTRTAQGKQVIGPDGKNQYPTPELLFKYKTGPSISTPIIVGNRMLAAGYKGIYLFEFDRHLNFTLLDHVVIGCESTPFAYQGRAYVASRDGMLYCLGRKK